MHTQDYTYFCKTRVSVSEPSTYLNMQTAQSMSIILDKSVALSQPSRAFLCPNSYSVKTFQDYFKLFSNIVLVVLINTFKEDKSLVTGTNTNTKHEHMAPTKPIIRITPGELAIVSTSMNKQHQGYRNEAIKERRRTYLKSMGR